MQNATGYGLEYKAAKRCSGKHIWTTGNADDGVSVSDSLIGSASITRDVTVSKSFAWDNGSSNADAAPSGFEVDDGPKRVRYEDCFATGTNAGSSLSGGGFDVGTHSGEVDPEDIEFVNCVSYNTHKRGFNITDAVGVDLINCRTIDDGERSVITDSAHGVRVDGFVAKGQTGTEGHGLALRGGVENVTITDLHGENNSQAGLYIDDAKEVTVGDSVFRNNSGLGGRGITIHKVDGLTIHDCNFTDNDGSGIAMGTDSGSGIRIHDCTFHDNGSYGVSINDSAFTDTILRDNEFSGNTDGEVSESGTRTVRNGRVLSPETLTLSGDEAKSPTEIDTKIVPFYIDAGWSARELEGVGGSLRKEGQIIHIIHTGGENVTLVHNDTAETDPLFMQGGSNVTLSTNGERRAFEYDSGESKWFEV